MTRLSPKQCNGRTCALYLSRWMINWTFRLSIAFGTGLFLAEPASSTNCALFYCARDHFPARTGFLTETDSRATRRCRAKAVTANAAACRSALAGVEGARRTDRSIEQRDRKHSCSGRGVPATTAPKLYHMGFGSAVARSTLADANESRDWRIFAHFAQVLVRTAIQLYANDATGIRDVHDLYALDPITIDLSLALFPWARFSAHKAAVKLHTLLDLRGSIPTFIRITDG